jgi:serine/threonine protein kinase
MHSRLVSQLVVFFPFLFFEYSRNAFLLISTPPPQSIYLLCDAKNKLKQKKIQEKRHPPRIQELDRLTSELKALELPNSPFLLHCYSCFESTNHVFFLVDRLTGGDLFSHLGQMCARGADKGFSEHQACILLAEVVVALQTLHSHNLVHRDVKVKYVSYSLVFLLLLLLLLFFFLFVHAFSHISYSPLFTTSTTLKCVLICPNHVLVLSLKCTPHHICVSQRPG